MLVFAKFSDFADHLRPSIIYDFKNLAEGGIYTIQYENAEIRICDRITPPSSDLVDQIRTNIIAAFLDPWRSMIGRYRLRNPTTNRSTIRAWWGIGNFPAKGGRRLVFNIGESLLTMHNRRP